MVCQKMYKAREVLGGAAAGFYNFFFNIFIGV